MPKWLKCMICKEKTSFCPSEPKYHRLLIDLLSRAQRYAAAKVKEEESTDNAGNEEEHDAKRPQSSGTETAPPLVRVKEEPIDAGGTMDLESELSSDAVKTEEYVVNTVESNDILPSAVTNTDTDDEDGLEPDVVMSNVAIKAEENTDNTYDGREHGGAERHEVDDSFSEQDNAIVLKFFQKLNYILEEQQGVFDVEMKEMIKKYPQLLDAKCPEDIKGKCIDGKECSIAKGCTATEVCCQLYGRADSWELLTVLVEVGAKATDRCYNELMSGYGVAYDHFVVLLLSGYIPLLTSKSPTVDDFVRGLNEEEGNEYVPGPMTLEMLSILYKTVMLGDRLNSVDIGSLIIDNINNLPQLQAGVTHVKDGPLDELLKRYPIAKVRELNEINRERVRMEKEENDKEMLTFFQKLNYILEEMHGGLNDEMKGMIKKNPSLLDAKCPEDIEMGHHMIAKGCTATEVCCEYDRADSWELLIELVCLGAKATDRCYNEYICGREGLHNHFIALLLSGQSH